MDNTISELSIKEDLCRCDKCSVNAACIHKGTFTRLPRELHGLGLCPKLKEFEKKHK